jgi:hypothetical protein
MTICGLIALFIALFLALQPAHDITGPATESADQSYATSREERVQAFKWFSTLGFTDVKDRKCVRVATGESYQRGDAPPRNSYVLGFLLRDKEGGFTVQTLSLVEETFKKTPPGTPDEERVSFEVKDLKAAGEAYLKSLRASATDPERDESPYLDFLPRRQTKTFVLAWACWRNGLDDLAAALFDEAGKMPAGHGLNADLPPTERLQTLVAEDLANTEMWRAGSAFDEPSVSRRQLLERFERIVKHYPDSEHHPKAKDYAALLRRMIKEDDEHLKTASKPFDKLSRQEQIAELVFQLRDQTGRQWSYPGSCDIFFDDRLHRADEHAKKSPASQLVEFGQDAIPQLIEVLEDDRLIRAVEDGHTFAYSRNVLRVGDCAAQILNRITDWEFGGQRVYTGKAAGSRAKAEAWWKEFQEKGEKQMLFEAVQKGDHTGVRLAHRLVEKYPEYALPALATGARNADADWHRAHLVACVGELKGFDRIGFLREELSGPFQRSRIVAAEALLHAGNDEGVSAIVREWKEIWLVDGRDAYEKSSGLISFLARSGKREAVQALAVDFRKRPVETRVHIVEALEGKERRPDKDASQEVQDVAESLLIETLDDTEMRYGMSISHGDERTEAPRVCDLAASALVDRWEKPDLFKLGGSPRNRNRQILELKNIYLKKLGKEPLPLPAPRTVTRAPEKRLAPLLDAVRTAKRPDDCRVGLLALESLGLPALPSVREALADLPADHPTRTHLAALASRLGFRIAEARFADNTVDTGDKLRERVSSLQNTNLTEQGFLDLLGDLIKDLPAGACSVCVDFERPGDDTGATLVVYLVVGPAKGQTWRSHHQVFVSNKSIHDSGSSTDKIGYEITKPEKEWAKLAKVIQKVLQSDPGKDVSILVECELR